MSGNRKNTVLRKPSGRIRAMVVIGGSAPITDALLTLRLADCNRQDAPMKVLAEKSVDLESRPSHDWIIVEFVFDWPAEDSEFKLSHMSLRCDITGKDGKLLYCTQVAQLTIDLTTGLEWQLVVVVEKV